MEKASLDKTYVRNLERELIAVGREMRSKNPFKDLPVSLIYLLPIALLCLYFFSLSFTPMSSQPHLPQHSNVIPNTSSIPSSTEMKKGCDYSNGEWVHDKRSPLYNGTTCDKIKQSQNCIANGRPDSSYLYWRWKPSDQCHLPRFEPLTFLQLVKNKHVAIVGDSVSRNQFESLLCMLGTASAPKRVHHKGSHRWHFLSHNANLSFYWSPFLVEGAQRSETGPNYCNTIYLDRVNEKWAKDVGEMDLIVLSLGHWFSVPSVYYEGGSVLGCLNCHEPNCIDIDFYGPLRKALRTALNSIIERKGAKGNRIDVIVRTYSPSHFEGDWNKGGTCSKTKPYREEEKQLEGVDAEIRRIEMEEVEIAKAKGKQLGRLRVEAMDVTKLALLRPDGHPGPYMNPFPFANGVQGRVQNDCVHWCLPGPADTWNEILLEIVKKWAV